MAITVATARTDLLTKVRMTGTFAFDVTTIYDILSKSQQLVNLLLSRVVDSATLTTSASTYFYDLRTEIPAAMRVLSVIESNRTLRKFSSWKKLAEYSRTWAADTGSRFEGWSPYGANQLIIYPAKSGASSVTVVYIKALDALSDQADTFELPDEDVPIVVDLAEIFILASLRRYKGLKMRIDSFVNFIKDYS